jgi:hypothetical protein
MENRQPAEVVDKFNYLGAYLKKKKNKEESKQQTLSTAKGYHKSVAMNYECQ